MKTVGLVMCPSLGVVDDAFSIQNVAFCGKVGRGDSRGGVTPPLHFINQMSQFPPAAVPA
jgi:hypothetical protein